MSEGIECTIRNFIDGCILNAHPLAALFGVAISLIPLAILTLCIGAIIAPPMSYFEMRDMKKQKEQGGNKDE